MLYISNKKNNVYVFGSFFHLFQKVHLGVIRFSETTLDSPEKALEPAKGIGLRCGSKYNKVFISETIWKEKTVCGECVYATCNSKSS